MKKFRTLKIPINSTLAKVTKATSGISCLQKQAHQKRHLRREDVAFTGYTAE